MPTIKLEQGNCFSKFPEETFPLVVQVEVSRFLLVVNLAHQRDATQYSGWQCPVVKDQVINVKTKSFQVPFPCPRLSTQGFYYIRVLLGHMWFNY